MAINVSSKVSKYGDIFEPLRFAIDVGISSTFSIIVSVLELFIASPKQVKISSKSWMLF